ncbi:MAG TPA: hypothetical protein VG963_12885 [Polyangiaceae bacterium]|nr:hypothetical protein [Polyangiaceae bacterium]
MLRPLFWAAAPALLALVSATAHAQDSAYCRQVRARAASDADLLMAPRVIVQGIHFPNGVKQLDSGATTENGYQLRTGLGFSVMDYYKGRGVLRVSEADCRRYEAARDLEDVLAHGADGARLVALREQIEFLRSKSEDWRALAARAAVRLSQRIITVFEFTNVQRSIDELEHKLVQVEGDEARLEADLPKADGAPSASGSLTRSVASAPPAAASRTAAPGSTAGPAGAPGGDAGAPSGFAGAATATGFAAKYYRETMNFEREQSRLRQLDDWRLQVTAGVIPQTPVDWYGTLELSFNLGSLVQGEHEQRYLQSRSEDVRYSRDGIETRLARFRTETAVTLEQAKRELGLVEHSLEVLRATRLALESSEAESAAEARDVLTLEQLSVEADSVFLRKFVDALASLVARAQG